MGVRSRAERTTAPQAKPRLKNLPLSEVYKLIEPGPVALLATARNGRPNVMTMSWHMMVEFEPPLIACVVSDRNFSFDALRATKECVIGIPSVDLAVKAVWIGNSSGRDADKFEAVGLTQMAASCVGAPLIGECFANLECKVVDSGFVKKYNLFILEVVKAWINPTRKNPKTIHHHGFGKFVVDGEAITLKSRKP
jgi:flavin reductase (DIM6/NTAB) family NADH-FMN oxidoreductase RutF